MEKSLNVEGTDPSRQKELGERRWSCRNITRKEESLHTKGQQCQGKMLAATHQDGEYLGVLVSGDTESSELTLVETARNRRD